MPRSANMALHPDMELELVHPYAMAGAERSACDVSRGIGYPYQIFTDFYRFFRLSWETSILKNYHEFEVSKSKTFSNCCTREYCIFNEVIPLEVE